MQSIAMPIAVVLFAIATVLAVIVGRLWCVNRRLSKALAEKTKAVDTTSKTLIEKHMELIDGNHRLQRLLQSKTDFLSIASHQLRTPLTSIKWGLSILSERIGDKLDPEEQELLKKSGEHASRMNRLIDELLDFVASEAGTYDRKKEKTNLELIVKEVASAASDHFHGRSVQVECDLQFGPEPVLVDPGLTKIVFENIIFNAFQYTPDDKHIFIKTLRKGDNFYFEVKDEGIGIPQERQQLIFSKFKRSPEALEINEMGIGLGLHITKNIIEKMGGEIGFESEGEGKGATFYFTIPASGK